MKEKYLEYIFFEPLKKATAEQIAFLGEATFFSIGFLTKYNPKILEDFIKDYPPVFESERSKRWIHRFKNNWYNLNRLDSPPLDEFIGKAKERMPEYARKEYENYLSHKHLE
ncbi:hypothetical protein [Streptococcus constellatus]|uniref:hypothetical protein n=1 Tax=Streptococcus constellatus TaxID=76860 RepID=UPI00066C9CB3|nr:hypothetical protein [Streptococcus constellatus]